MASAMSRWRRRLRTMDLTTIGVVAIGLAVLMVSLFFLLSRASQPPPLPEP